LLSLSTFPVVIPFIVFEDARLRCVLPMHLPSSCCLFADIFLHVTLDFGHGQRA
jgi:hypothetical protein